MIDLVETKITVAQALALYRVYERGPLYFRPEVGGKPGLPSNSPLEGQDPMHFEDFVKSIQIGSDCIMVPWLGMWLGIEKDGYTHS